MPWCASLSGGGFCLDSRRAWWTASWRHAATSTAGHIVDWIRLVDSADTVMPRVAVACWASQVGLMDLMHTRSAGKIQRLIVGACFTAGTGCTEHTDRSQGRLLQRK